MKYPGTHLSKDTVVDSSAWIAPTAELVGSVEIGRDSSVWYQTVLRGDLEKIVIGNESNLQDGVIVHMASDCPTIVGNRVTVGHGSILHACNISDHVLIGMRSTIMDQSRVGKGSIVGAGSLITKGQEFPEYHLIMGSPAKAVRKLVDEEIESIDKLAEKYVALKNQYQELGK